MTSLVSGDFIEYQLHDDPNSPTEIGLVLRTSANEKTDGSQDEFVELIGPLTKVMVPDHLCRKFDEEPEPDPNEVVGSNAEPVGSIRSGQPAKASTTKGK